MSVLQEEIAPCTRPTSPYVCDDYEKFCLRIGVMHYVVSNTTTK